MKNFLYSILILVILALTTGMKCNKDDLNDPDSLPKATHVGANVLACKVNGDNWIAGKNSLNKSAGFKNDSLSIFGENPDEVNYSEVFIIRVAQVNNQLVFRLNQANHQYVDYSTTKNCFNKTSGYGFGDSKSTDGELKITYLDRSKKIIAGTFWFNIPTDKCGILKVTDGRFDIRYD